MDDGGVDSLNARTNKEFNGNKVRVLSGKYSKDHSTLCFVASLGLTSALLRSELKDNYEAKPTYLFNVATVK